MTTETIYFGGTDVPALVGRLQAIIDAPKLTLSIEGGGVPEKQSLIPEMAVIADRRDIEAVVGLLRANDLVPR